MATLTTAPIKTSQAAVNLQTAPTNVTVNRTISSIERMIRKDAVADIFIGKEERHYAELAERTLSDLDVRRRAWLRSVQDK